MYSLENKSSHIEKNAMSVYQRTMDHGYQFFRFIWNEIILGSVDIESAQIKKSLTIRRAIASGESEYVFQIQSKENMLMHLLIIYKKMHTPFQMQSFSI